MSRQLGAGTGVAGLAAASLGSKFVALTDLEYAVSNLQRNINETFAMPLKVNSEECMDSSFENTSIIKAQFLDWANPSTYFFPSNVSNEVTTNYKNEECSWDIILGADIVWLEELIPSLLQALNALASSKTTVYLAHQVRFILNINVKLRNYLMNSYYY